MRELNCETGAHNETEKHKACHHTPAVLVQYLTLHCADNVASYPAVPAFFRFQ